MIGPARGTEAAETPVVHAKTIAGGDDTVIEHERTVVVSRDSVIVSIETVVVRDDPTTGHERTIIESLDTPAVLSFLLKIKLAVTDDAGMGMLRLLLNLVRPPMALLRVEIVADQDLRYHVVINRVHPDVVEVEFVWLPLLYSAKMLYLFSRSKALSSSILLHALSRVAEQGVCSDTDCLAAADFADIAGISTAKPTEVDWRMTATLRFKNPSSRGIITHFPMRGTEQQAVFSVFALLQSCTSHLSEDGQNVLTRALREMVHAYATDYSMTVMNNIFFVPHLAYVNAVMEHSKAA